MSQRLKPNLLIQFFISNNIKAQYAETRNLRYRVAPLPPFGYAAAPPPPPPLPYGGYGGSFVAAPFYPNYAMGYNGFSSGYAPIQAFTSYGPAPVKSDSGADSDNSGYGYNDYGIYYGPSNGDWNYFL